MLFSTHAYINVGNFLVRSFRASREAIFTITFALRLHFHINNFSERLHTDGVVVNCKILCKILYVTLSIGIIFLIELETF